MVSIVEKSLQKYRDSRAEQSLPANRSGEPTPTSHSTEAGAANERRRAPRVDPSQPRFFETLGGRAVNVDLAALCSMGLYPTAQSESAIRDQLRRVKWPLLEMAIGRKAADTPNGRLILVTSSLPNEGKTFCALNLALSIAREKDLSVLLVDGDVRKAHISRALGVDGEPGLVELIEDKGLSLRDLCLRTSIPQLFLLPAGRFNLDVPEHWASARMHSVMQEMALLDRQSIVVLDSSPILLTNDTQVLTRLVGQVAFIVRASSTPCAVVSEALSLVDRVPVVSAVLNQSSEATNEYYAYGAYPYPGGTNGAVHSSASVQSK